MCPSMSELDDFCNGLFGIVTRVADRLEFYGIFFLPIRPRLADSRMIPPFIANLCCESMG
jgi:hypothetical protein